MSIFEWIANSIFRIATGDVRRRWFYTPLVAFVFLCFIALFFVRAHFTDTAFNLPPITWLPWTAILGIVLLLPGGMLLLWTWIQFLIAHGTPVPINPPRQLITDGLYAYSRNPMLLGIFLLFFGTGFLSGSLSLTAVFSPLCVLIFYFQVTKIEELEMELKFGQAYLNYKKIVPRFIPFPRKVNK